MKFPKGERVVFKHQEKNHTGRVTEVLHKVRRVVSDTGQRTTVPLAALKRAADRVLILETRLDRNLRSGRIYGHMMKQWLEAYDKVEVLYEKVHTIEDMRQFIRLEGRRPGTRFIHYIGHGDTQGAKCASLKLTFESLDLLEHIDVFKNLGGKVLLFSCCQVGSNKNLLEKLKVASGASAVIAYRTMVDDHFTNLTEVLLYDRIFAGVKPSTAVNQVSRALLELGIKSENERKPVLVCV